MSASRVSGLKLLDKALDVGGNDFFGGLPLLRLFGVSLIGVTLLVVFMGASSLGFGAVWLMQGADGVSRRANRGRG